VIYLDSSALLKLLVEEAESAPLAAWLTGHTEQTRATSVVAKVEVLRAIRRLATDAVPAATALLSQLDLVPVSEPVVDAATVVGDVALRSLDAIHLASALSLGQALTALVAYDRRLCAAALAAGVTVERPGSIDHR